MCFVCVLFVLSLCFFVCSRCVMFRVDLCARVLLLLSFGCFDYLGLFCYCVAFCLCGVEWCFVFEGKNAPGE